MILEIKNINGKIKRIQFDIEFDDSCTNIVSKEIVFDKIENTENTKQISEPESPSDIEQRKPKDIPKEMLEMEF